MIFRRKRVESPENLSEPEPGTFRPADKKSTNLGGELLEFLQRRQAGLEIYGDSDDSFVCALRGIKDKLNLEDGSTVVYPGSHTHVGVARVFGKENVTHVDPDHEATQVLAKADFKAVETGVEDYEPDEPADVMVALNSYGSPTSEIVQRLVKPGGFVIANNYTHWANKLNGLQDSLRLVAAIMPSYGAADARLVEASELPEEATGSDVVYSKLEGGGEISRGTPEDHDVAIEMSRNPDALFIFERFQ